MQNTLFFKKVARKFAHIKKKQYLCTVKLKKHNQKYLTYPRL